METVYAVTPGHGEIKPCPELTREEILEGYKENLKDTIIGFVEIYNKYNSDDKLEDEVIDDWLEMEMETIRNTEGPNQIWYQLQKIKEKYENEVDRIVGNNEQ